MGQLILKVISVIGLLLMLVPSVLLLHDAIEESMVKTFMMIGTLVWFATATFWLGKREKTESQ